MVWNWGSLYLKKQNGAPKQQFIDLNNQVKDHDPIACYQERWKSDEIVYVSYCLLSLQVIWELYLSYIWSTLIALLLLSAFQEGRKENRV